MIVLPTKLTEETWFYKENKKVLRPHLGKYYISYSSITSWEEYKNDFIKEKFANLPKELFETVYTRFGNYLGTAVEKGKFPEENPDGFEGQEHFSLIPRPKKGKYERFVCIDFGEFVFIGFIDIYEEKENKVDLGDLKSGGAKKEQQYAAEEYIQVILYSRALEHEGKEIGNTYVWFVRREGSHVKPPLRISEEQFRIDIEYNEERVDYAMKKLKRVVEEISDCYQTYLKIFGDE